MIVHLSVDDRYSADIADELRRLVDDGFSSVETVGVEVHLKAVAPRVVWLAGCVDRDCRPALDLDLAPPRGARLAPSGLRRAHVVRTRRRAALLGCETATGIRRWVDDRSTLMSGYTYGSLPTMANVEPETVRLVTVKLPLELNDDAYPHRWIYHRARSVGPVEVRSWREQLVHLVAHEARHVVQFRDRLALSEVDAQRWANEVLDRWRTTQ